MEKLGRKTLLLATTFQLRLVLQSTKFAEKGRCGWRSSVWGPVQLTGASFLLFIFVQVSLDNLYVSAVNHIFQEQLKPKLLAATSSGHLWPVDKRTEETMQAVQSYLLSITNPEWATALTHQIAQELPTGWFQRDAGFKSS